MNSFERYQNTDALIYDAVNNDRGLKAIMQLLNNPRADFSVFEEFADEWNKNHPPFTRKDLENSVSKAYCGRQGALITIWISGDKVRMMANYDDTADINKNPETAEDARKKYSIPNFN